MQDRDGIVMPLRSENAGRGGDTHTHMMDEGRARALANRIAATKGYVVVDVRRAWSAAWAWHVAASVERTGARLLLLSDDHWNDHLACT